MQHIKPISNFLAATIAAQIHLLGFFLAIIGAWQLYLVVDNHSWQIQLGMFLFSVGGAFVFAVSSVYHFWHDGVGISDELMEVFEILDHCSIYLFIASCYHVFFLFSVAPAWQNALVALAWISATLGITYTIFRKHLPKILQSRFLYTGLFVLMGFTFLIRINEVVGNLSMYEFKMFLTGGAAYTIGAICYATRWPNLIKKYFGYHELWHVFVLLGWAFHFALMYQLVTAHK